MKTIGRNLVGCNEDVAVALNAGLQILCKVWDDVKKESCTTYVSHYEASNNFPYKTMFSSYKNAKPIDSIVKDKHEIMNWFVQNNWMCDSNGHWRAPNDVHPPFIDDMFEYCGKAKSKCFIWREEWLND